MLSCVIPLLMGSSMAPELSQPALDYLSDALGLAAQAPDHWPGERGLPAFLLQTFRFRVIELLGQQVLLMFDRQPGSLTPGEVRSRVATARRLVGMPTIYVTGALASYDRKRLVEQKIPFLVPGNQLYLPDLGIDLREYFRKRALVSEGALSPSAQGLLIAMLLPPLATDYAPAQRCANSVGLTAMTRSRAVNELSAAGLIEKRQAGRTIEIRLAGSPSDVWERANPMLRSPVQKTVWTRNLSLLATTPGVRAAGLTALGAQTMLGEPRVPVIAVHRPFWLEQSDAMGDEPGVAEVQLWWYPATLGPDKAPGDRSAPVDPLSLTLSLRDDPEPRVQQALEQLKEQFPW